MDTIVQIVNKALSNKFMRFSLMVLFWVFMGYTLQPVPKWLNNLFNTSNVFKFAILFIVFTISFYPLTPKTILWSALGSLALLFIFEGFRSVETEAFKYI